MCKTLLLENASDHHIKINARKTNECSCRSLIIFIVTLIMKHNVWLDCRSVIVRCVGLARRSQNEEGRCTKLVERFYQVSHDRSKAPSRHQSKQKAPLASKWRETLSHIAMDEFTSLVRLSDGNLWGAFFFLHAVDLFCHCCRFLEPSCSKWWAPANQQI